MTPRSELHKPGLGPCFKNYFKQIKTVVDFSKTQGRKDTLFKSPIETPESPSLEKFDKAFLKQSRVRG